MKKNLYLAIINKKGEMETKAWLVLASSEQGAKKIISERGYEVDYANGRVQIYEGDKISFAKPYARIWFKGLVIDFDYHNLPCLNKEYYDKKRENFVANYSEWRKAEDALYNNYLNSTKGMESKSESEALENI